MLRFLPSRFKAKPEPAEVATRAQLILPDEMVLHVLKVATPASLNIELTAANSIERRPLIAAANVEQWKSVQGLLRLTPRIALLTGNTSGQILRSELVIRFTNETLSAHKNETIPDSILARFATVRVELPLSVRAINGPRHLGILSMRFYLDGRTGWEYRGEETTWISVKGNSPHLLAFVHYLISNIGRELQDVAYDGALDSRLLKHVRGKVEFLLEDTEDWLPVGWTVQTLEQGILDHEEFAMKVLERQADQRLSCVVWVLAVVLCALLVRARAPWSKVFMIGMLMVAFQCAMSAKMAGKL